MPLTRKQDNMINGRGWFRAVLLLVLLLLSLQGCATNFRGDYRFGRLSSSEESQRAGHSLSGTVGRSELKDGSSERSAYERKLSAPGRSSSHSNTNQPSVSSVFSDAELPSDGTLGDLFDGPLVGFVATSLLLRWSHPLIWMSAVALAVIIESEAMEYLRESFFGP